MTMISENAGFGRPPLQLAAARPENQARPDQAASASDDEFRPFGEDGFTFFDFLDIINPLQHIPVVGTLYRQFTGDQIDPGSRVLGSTLFLGPFGTAAAIGDVLIREATGKDVGEHVVALFQDQAPDKATAAKDDGPVVTAAAEPAAAVAAPTEPVDPITAWAMGEVAYRNGIAAKLQASRARPAEVAAVAPAAVAPIASAAAFDGVRQWAAQTTAASAAAKPDAATSPFRDRNAAIRDATQVIRHARKSGALWAASTYGRTGPATDRNDSEGPKRAADRPAPSGAVAAGGGWFTDVMLSAHEKYKAGGGRTPAHVVDLAY